MIKTNGWGICVLLLLCVIGSGIVHFDSFVVSKMRTGWTDGERCVEAVSNGCVRRYRNGYSIVVRLRNVNRRLRWFLFLDSLVDFVECWIMRFASVSRFVVY